MLHLAFSDFAYSAAMAPDMIPGMIQQGYRAIAVAFDVWGFANLVNTSLAQGRAFAQKSDEANEVTETNGTIEANGTIEVNGKANANGIPHGEKPVAVSSK
jgi:4-hydroxy-2-oxoheptanedioate aldolase